MKIQDYEHNLSVNSRRVAEAAQSLTRLSFLGPPDDDLLTEMTEAIRLVRQARRDLSVAKSVEESQREPTFPDPKALIRMGWKPAKD